MVGPIDERDARRCIDTRSPGVIDAGLALEWVTSRCPIQRWSSASLTGSTNASGHSLYSFSPENSNASRATLQLTRTRDCQRIYGRV